MDKKRTRCHFCVIFISTLQVAQHVSGNMCPSSGADDCVVLSPHVGIVPWLQEGCQNQLAGSVSIEEFVVRCATHYLLTGSDSLPATTAQYQYVAIKLRSR